MKPENLNRLEDSYSFQRPAAIVGQVLNNMVAEAATRRIKNVLTGGEDKAVEVLCREVTRHAYDRIEAHVPITAEEQEVLGAIGERIAKALVDALTLNNALPSTKIRKHTARVNEAMRKAGAPTNTFGTCNGMAWAIAKNTGGDR